LRLRRVRRKLKRNPGTNTRYKITIQMPQHNYVCLNARFAWYLISYSPDVTHAESGLRNGKLRRRCSVRSLSFFFHTITSFNGFTDFQNLGAEIENDFPSYKWVKYHCKWIVFVATWLACKASIFYLLNACLGHADTWLQCIDFNDLLSLFHSINSGR
jgi:hypothetical protein